MKLRQANNGPVIVGSADGDVLTWSDAEQEWFPAAPPAGGTIVPLPGVRYVDADSAVADPDGSIAKPYLTVQAAFNDLQALNQFTIFVAPSVASPGDLTVPGPFDANCSIVGMGPNQVSRETDGESTGYCLCAVMGTITYEAAGTLGNCRIGAENINIDAFVATNDGPPQSVRFMMTGCECLSINAPGGRLYTYQSTLRTVVCSDAVIYQAQLNDGASFNCPNGLQLDYDTYHRAALMQLTLPSTAFVVGSAPSVQLTVTVPTLASGELGYATVDVSGTLLDGLSVRDIVCVNFANDLAAAGAGNGGFINPRVSASNTVKLAFLGALAGGDTAVNIAKVSTVIPPPS